MTIFTMWADLKFHKFNHCDVTSDALGIHVQICHRLDAVVNYCIAVIERSLIADES